MDSKYYQQSDCTHIYNFLKIKIPKILLFIPLVSNAVMFLIFSSLLDVKLTDRKLALKLRIKHNFYVVIFPMFLLFSLIISTIVLALNYTNFKLEKYSFFLLFLGHFLVYFLFNPLVLSFRNNWIQNKYYKVASENLIKNAYNPTVIKNWKIYLLNYVKFYKGKALYRASDNFKLSIDKPIIFNDKHIEYKKNKEMEEFYYSFHPFEMLLSKYFGSLFSSAWLAYLLVLSKNFENEILLDLKIKNKMIINWLINFVFVIGFIALSGYVSFSDLKINQYFIALGIFGGLSFIYLLVSIGKMFLIRQLIKLEILSFIGWNANPKSKNDLGTDFLIIDQNDASKKSLANNLLKINRYMIEFSVIIPFIISLVFVILGFNLAVPIMYYVAFVSLALTLVTNYVWIIFLLYLAKKINCKPILVNKIKIILFSPLSLFLKS